MKRLFVISVLILISVAFSFGQTNTGTLKIFSEIEGISVFVDEIQQTNYQNIEKLPVGTHYVRVMNGTNKVYSQVVTINKDQVTTVLIEKSNASEPQQTTIQSEKPVDSAPVQQTDKTGTLNIFSEIEGYTVFLNDKSQGQDIRTINSVPAGNHYLKITKEGVNIFGELVTITGGQTTTVLVKNDGQVAQKMLESKSKEREEYNASKIDVLFASKSITQTQGSSTLFPGYYGYWGYSKSISSTTEIPDFKIIQGGVQEISDLTLARLANNKSVLDQNAKDNLKINKMVNIGAPLLLIGTITTLVYLADFTLDKPFLHKNNPEHPEYEAYAATGGILAALVGYGIVSSSSKVIPNHYYRVQDAAKDAQIYNTDLKKKLGLPDDYDIK